MPHPPSSSLSLSLYHLSSLSPLPCLTSQPPQPPPPTPFFFRYDLTMLLERNAVNKIYKYLYICTFLFCSNKARWTLEILIYISFPFFSTIIITFDRARIFLSQQFQAIFASFCLVFPFQLRKSTVETIETFYEWTLYLTEHAKL